GDTVRSGGEGRRSVLNVFRIPVRPQRLVLLFVDMIIFALSLPAATLIRNAGMPPGLPSFSPSAIPAILIAFFHFYTGATTITVGTFVLVFFIADLYTTEGRRFRPRDVLSIVIVSAVGVLAVSTLYYLIPNWKVGRGILLIQAGLIAASTFA